MYDLNACIYDLNAECGIRQRGVQQAGVPASVMTSAPPFQVRQAVLDLGWPSPEATSACCRCWWQGACACVFVCPCGGEIHAM